MATYRTFAELQGKELEYLDRVVFEHEGYGVECDVGSIGLMDISRIRIENKIFTLLGLDPWEFCKQHYTKLHHNWGYHKNKHPEHWPPYYEYDYEPITKVVLELFRLIEESEKLAETSEILFID